MQKQMQMQSNSPVLNLHINHLEESRRSDQMGERRDPGSGEDRPLEYTEHGPPTLSARVRPMEPVADSLQPPETDQQNEEDMTPPPTDISHLNGQEGVLVHDYQDSLNTPQEDCRRNQYDDYKYDPTDLQNKQYFMPQAYPPASSKARQRKELQPHLSRQSLEQPTQSAQALTYSNYGNQYSDPAVSFRQQTFDKGFFVKEGEGTLHTGPNGTSVKRGPHRTSSVDLHQRSAALQDRIGDLEQMLRARIADQSRDTAGDEENEHVKEEPHIIASESMTSFEKSDADKAHSSRQTQTSYLQTETALNGTGQFTGRSFPTEVGAKQQQEVRQTQQALKYV